MHFGESGMSLRAWLAGQALCGLLADTNNISSSANNASAAVIMADATITALNGETESHKEVAARIMQLEAVIEGAQSAMLAHIGLCEHYNVDHDGRCDWCPSFSAKTCPIRMCLAGMGNSKAWEPAL